MNKIYLLMLVLFFGLWLLGPIVAGVSIGSYLSLPSFVLVIGPAIILSLCNYSPQEIVRYFGIGFKKENLDRRELKNGVLFFEALQRYFILSGITGFLVGLVAIFLSMENTAGLTFGLAVAITIILYSLLLVAAVAIPFRTGLQKRLNETI